MEGGNLRGFSTVDVYEAFLKKGWEERGVQDFHAHTVKGGYVDRVWALRAQNGERQMIFDVYNSSDEAEMEVQRLLKEAMGHEGGYDKGDEDFHTYSHMSYRTLEIEVVDVEETLEENDEKEAGET